MDLDEEWKRLEQRSKFVVVSNSDEKYIDTQEKQLTQS